MVSTKIAATAALTMASAAMAAPKQHKFDTLLGIPKEDSSRISAAWAADAPIPKYVTMDRDQLMAAGKGNKAEPSAPPSHKEKRDVLGGFDDRELWDSTDFPYNAMGKITWSSGVWCSGSLVGPRHVATAKHCAPGDGEDVVVRFMPGYYDGERFGGANVETIISLPEYDVNDNPDSCDWKEDWAIFILDARLGDTQGYLGATSPSAEQLEQALFWNYGFPGDKGGEEPYVSDANTIFAGPFGCDDFGPYLTDTDVVGGQSGGPNWIPDDGNGLYQYAITSGSSSANSIFSGGDRWVNAINQARTDYP